MIQQMLAIWSLVPLPFLIPAWTFGSSWFTYCWSLTWRILSITLLACEMKEMGIPYHLTCLLRNLYAGQEATVRTGHGTTDWFQIGKGVCQSCILSPCLFNLHAEYIWRRQWPPTPVLLPGKSHGRRSLEGYSPWGLKESDTTERLHFSAWHFVGAQYLSFGGPWGTKNLGLDSVLVELK